jgi:hypothetical protein
MTADSGTIETTGPEPGDREIVVTPDPANLGFGDEQQFTATLVTVGAADQDVTADATWSVEDDALPAQAVVGTITDGGLFTAGGACAAGTVTATYDGLEGTSQVTVDGLIGLEVAPADDMTGDDALTPGDTVNFTATAVYCDRNEDVTDEATWTFSGPAETGAVDANGLFTADAVAGTGVVTADYEGMTADSGTLEVVTGGDVPIVINQTEGGRE